MQINVKGKIAIPREARIDTVESIAESLNGFGRVAMKLPRELSFDFEIDNSEDSGLPHLLTEVILGGLGGNGADLVQAGIQLGWAVASKLDEIDTELRSYGWAPVNWDECLFQLGPVEIPA